MTAMLASQDILEEERRGNSVSDVVMRMIDPMSGFDWDAMVLSHPSCSCFHSSAWARVLAETYGHKPFYFRMEKEGRLLASLPIMEVNSRLTGRRGVCLPFSDFCGPLLFERISSEDLFAGVLTVARERRWRYLEIRNGEQLTLKVEPALKFQRHILNLKPGARSLFDQFSSAVRRGIKKAEQSNLKVEVSRSRESILQFYRLHVQTRKRHGMPPQPVSFFQNIFEHVIGKGHGFIVRAESDSKCVAASVFLQFGRSAVYKFGASDSTSLHLRPNNLVMWKAISFLADTGCELLDFGRTSPLNPGLRRFKLGWGAAEGCIGYGRWNTDTARWAGGGFYRSRGLYNALFSKLPLALNRLTGTLVYPHLD